MPRSAPDGEVRDRLVEARDLAKLAKQKTGEAYRADILAEADAVAEGGKPVPNSKRSEGPAKLREAEAERNVQVLTQAAHRTAERVTQAIVETRDSWIIDLEQREAEAADQFREALAELTTAAHTFRATRGATAWLSDVDVERGVLPLQVSDGALSVPVGASRNGIGGGQSRNSGGGRRVGPPKGVG